MDNYQINVKHIDQTWSCCNYKYRVFVEDFVFDMKRSNYVLETLAKWFGAAEHW